MVAILIFSDNNIKRELLKCKNEAERNLIMYVHGTTKIVKLIDKQKTNITSIANILSQGKLLIVQFIM